MATMEKLIRRFNKMNPAYKAELDWIDSYEGWYTVVITEPEYGIPAHYHFNSCKEFRDWMDNVVLD